MLSWVSVPCLFHTRSRPHKVFSTYSPCITVGTSKRQSSFHTLRIKYAIQALRIRQHRNVHSEHVVVTSSHISSATYADEYEIYARSDVSKVLRCGRASYHKGRVRAKGISNTGEHMSRANIAGGPRGNHICVGYNCAKCDAKACSNALPRDSSGASSKSIAIKLITNWKRPDPPPDARWQVTPPSSRPPARPSPSPPCCALRAMHWARENSKEEKSKKQKKQKNIGTEWLARLRCTREAAQLLQGAVISKGQRLS